MGLKEIILEKNVSVEEAKVSENGYTNHVAIVYNLLNEAHIL
jgi:hypothetical protein